MNDFDRKLAAALSELTKAGVRPSSAYPPVQVLLTKMGLKSRPPHYAPFIVALNIAAIAFTIAWGGLMWFLSWSNSGMSADQALKNAFYGGIIFGLVMALSYAHGRRKHNLTPWHKL